MDSITINGINFKTVNSEYVKISDLKKLAKKAGLSIDDTEKKENIELSDFNKKLEHGLNWNPKENKK